MARKHGQITVTLVVYEEDGAYVAKCKELGTASCGDTIDEAFANIKEAVLLHLDTLEDIGEREHFFKEKGIRIEGTKPKRTHQQISEVRVPTGSFLSKHEVPV